MALFPRLFSPGRIGRLHLRNRIIMAPMEKNLASPDGTITQRYTDYMIERAAGGAALLLLESMYIDPVGKNHTYQLGLHDDAVIPGYRRLADAVHAYGALLGAEIQFAGRETSSTITGFQPVAPSPVPCAVLTGGDVPRELTVGEIRELVWRFAQAAQRARSAGFDLVEIHGAHGYLVGQFLSPFSNRRTDEYGGSWERRMRFPLEVVAAVRKAVGSEVPVAYRMSADECVEGGLTILDTAAFAKVLEQAGVDLIDVSAGIYESAVMIAQPMEFPAACLSHLSTAIRGQVGIPVSVAGRINDPQVAEWVLESGRADFVSMGRALHADPHLPRKAQAGRQDEICLCVGCLKCSELLGQNVPVLCLVNTGTGREREYRIRRTPHPKRVVVVGGGPAGMEAARVAALRGHQVTLFERNVELGGQIRFTRRVPHREDLAGMIAWLEAGLRRAGVDIRLGTQATVEHLLALNPDEVVMATGATPGWPEIPGILDGPTVDPFQVLGREQALGRKALVVGGLMLGCNVAAFLAAEGLEVILAEAGDTLSADLGLRPRWQMVQDLRARREVTIHLRTTVERFEGNTALLHRPEGEEKVTGLDLVVPTRTLLPNAALSEAIQRAAAELPLHEIGDCVQPRTAFEAMQEGAAVGHRI